MVPCFAALAHVALPQLLAGLAVLVGIRYRSLAEKNRGPGGLWTNLPGQWLHLFCLPPPIFPWYLLWLLPFLMSASHACRSLCGR